MAAETYSISRMVNSYHNDPIGPVFEDTDYNDHVHLDSVWILDDELCPDCSSPEIVVTYLGPERYRLEKVEHDATCPVVPRRKKGVGKKVRKRA